MTRSSAPVPSRASTPRAICKGLLVSNLVASLLVLPPTSALAGKGAVSDISIKATLDPGREVPKQTDKVARAKGLLAGTLVKTKTGYSFAWKLTYSKTSGPATFTNVQNATVGKHGTVIMFLCGPCKSGAQGKIYASPGEVSLLMQGELYVNLTTKHNPAGEIRGQLRKTG